MTPGKKEIVSIALLLKHPRVLELETVQRAAEMAYRGAPNKPKVIAVPNGTFGIALGPMRLGVINREQPYFKDIAKAADRVCELAGRMAIQEHTAWMSVDLVGDPPPIERAKVYGLIGCLIAEFLDDNVLGLIRLPGGPVIGYDFSYIPKFRARQASEVFEQGSPDRTVKASADNQNLLAATAEARRRWPEFVAAFANRQPKQGFAVKKKFVEHGSMPEHMWVEVTRIEGSIIHGLLSNKPNHIKSLKFRDPLTLSVDEVQDWMYTNGKENVGGFQAKVLRK